MQSCPWVAMSKTHEQNHESFTKLMSSCWRLLKPWVSHLQNHLQGVNIICNNLKSFATATSCVGREKKILLRQQKEHVLPEKKSVFRLILVGRSKFKFWTKFVVEAKMMKKLPKKLLHFSPHCWYHFFSLHRWYTFSSEKTRSYCFNRKKGHNPSFSNVAFLPFFAF